MGELECVCFLSRTPQFPIFTRNGKAQRTRTPPGRSYDAPSTSREACGKPCPTGGVVFIGKPQQNAIVRSLLEGKDLVADDLGTIRVKDPRPGEAPEYRSAVTHGAGEKYALISLLVGPQPDPRMLILSGAGAELMWALAEAVTNRDHVKGILSHVRTPEGEVATSFQVLIRAAFQSNVPVKIRYVTHRVLDGS